MGQVSGCALVWSGLAEVVRSEPNPPPNCPTITIDVGILLAPLANDKLFVRLICNGPGGTVMTTGDQKPAAAANGFKGTHVAGLTSVPQV
jgi:hypothetical protein